MRVENFWQIGNTGWRSPERLPAVLKVIDRIYREKKLHTAESFWDKISSSDLLEALVKENVLTVNEKSKSKTNGLQKAISSLRDHGFLEEDKKSQKPLLTPLGLQMVAARNTSARQLVFAQALCSLKFKNPRGENSFSPLIHILKVARALEKSNKKTLIHKEEMIFILSSSGLNTPKEVADQILDYRERKDVLSQGSNKSKNGSLAFEEELERVRYALATDGKQPLQKSSLENYIDVTLRHLAFSGLFHGGSAHGFGHISLIKNQSIWIDALLNEKDLDNIWNNPNHLYKLVEELNQEVKKRIEKIPGARTKWLSLSSTSDLLTLRTHYCDLRETMTLLQRGDLFQSVSNVWMLNFLDSVANKKTASWINKEEINLDSNRPAMLEWSVYASLIRCSGRPVSTEDFITHEWRGSYDHRNQPSSTAPGQGEDAWVDLGSSVVCVETTTTTSDRQYATEGQSVTRHVVDRMEKSKKPVWGLFIAPKLDPNTLGTYQSGWYVYGSDEVEKAPRVVPFTTNQWHRVLTVLHHQGQWNTAKMEIVFERAWASRLDLEPGSSPASQALQWRDNLENLIQVFEKEGVSSTLVKEQSKKEPKSSRLKSLSV